MTEDRTDDELGADELSGADGDVATAPRDRAARSPLRRLLIGFGVLAVVLGLAVAGGTWVLTDRYAGNVGRVAGVFDGLDEAARPAPAQPAQQAAAVADPVTFLLVGSDTRAAVVDGQLPDARSDAIMIARLSGDREHVQFVSIPRDSWVDIPGHGKDKINAAYSYGGPSLLIQTVENLTGVRIDHFAAISFDELISMTDQLGGVDVQVAETTTNGPYTFTAGLNHLDGDMARWYVGQRYDLPGGDFDRVARQQNYLRSMFGKLFTAGTFGSIGQVDSVLRIITSSVAVDDTLSATDLLSLAWSARGVTPADVAFFTAPVLGTGMEGAASVVYLDQVTGDRMWGYLDTDSLGQNAAEFADQALPATPR